MPDESTNNQSKKDEKRNTTNRGPQKPPTGASSTPGNGPRPTSGGGNRKPAQGPRGGAPNLHRKSPSGAPSGRGNNSPNPPSSQEQPSDALSSLQRVIADLKTTAPQQPSAGYQPSAQGFNPNSNTHRKAASLGSQGQTQSGAFGSSYAPHLGPMNEDTEETNAAQGYEDVDSQYRNQARGGGQGFVAPRFAALAAQQQQEAINSAGRPQLAPGFHFGGQRAPGVGGLGPPINEEDLNFQFPQQTQQKTNAPEVSGIVAEQRAIQAQIESLQAHQAALYQQQLASGQVMSFQTPGLAPAGRAQAHRRAQSNMPVGMGNFGGGANQFNNLGGNPGAIGGFGAGNDAQGIPRGHGRRHSVNVVNKSAGTGSLSYPAPFQQDQFDDGFAPPSSFNPGQGGGPGGHSRQGSRVDNSWRINGGVGGVQGQGNNFGSDLAQAQAQLQSLQQFRAAAGGHHQKMASFSFPNMLPNMMAANMMGMGLGGINLLQQQHQQFQSQLQQQSNQPQRKSLFAPYLPQASLPPLLAAGKLVVGILRVNKRNRSDAYVATEVLDADIYICGSKDRNRALEGDIVAVELLDVEEVWNTKREKEDKKRKKEENAAFESKTAAGRKDDKRKDDVEVEGQGLMLFEDEEVTDDVKPQFAGHVVAVVERMPGQLFSGTLGLLRPSSAATKEKQEAERREREGDRGDEPRRAPIERPKIVWFKPTDKRVPLIAIPTEQAPPDFVNNAEAYVNHLFVACIKRHPISSLHPFGTLVEDLGPIGDVEVETSALLKDCNFPSEEFAENVMKCLPPIPWTIPEREYEIRKDLRQERIFTIDPSTAKDLDDALHIKHNEDGTYEVGVHIADVAFFVKPNTALDREARKRATSVYLVQRAVPMLPPSLSEDLCSLNPGVERLTVSFIFTLNAEARITNTWFGKTIIKSVAKLAYGQAQDVIEGQVLSAPVAPEFNVSDVSHDIKILHDLATQLRTRRFQEGALAFDTPKMKFDLDEEGFPTDCAQVEREDANYLIEEFMLLANTAAAQQVAVNLPEQALLRRHDTPLERRLNAYVERATRLGYEMDTTSAGTLMKSFDAVTDQTTKLILQLLSRKATHRARYFCAGMLDIAKYGHYALNLPLYTHFTSPIRRYSDILVHRQLDSIIADGPEKFPMDRDAVAKVAQQCNIKKDSARLAQEQSAHLFLCLLISDLTQRYGPVVRQAKVVGVLDAAFDVLVPEFGIEKRVHVDQMPINNHQYDQHTHTLQIYWSEKDVITWLAENSDDEHLKKVKLNAEQHAHTIKMEVNSRSHNDEQALFDEDDEDDEVLLGRSQKEQAQETSAQRLRSLLKAEPTFEGIRTTAAGHQVQEIKELMTVPVIVTADLTRSPPVIKVYSVNPFAKQK